MTKEYSNILRACAILSIAMHNLLHTSEMGYAQECEMIFDISRFYYLVGLLSHPNATIIFDLISFIGWSGISVFVFLSGYGLAKKYDNKEIKIRNYLKHSYLKLLFLALPAAFTVIPLYIIKGQYEYAVLTAASLSMLQNLIPNYVANIYNILPPYWYLCLTFELYVLWGMLHKWLTNNGILVLGGVMFPSLIMAVLPLLNVDMSVITYLRRNFVAWLPLFCMGICIAKSDKGIIPSSIYLRILVMFTSLFLAFLVHINYYTWLLSPFLSLFFFIVLSSVIEECHSFKVIFAKIGEYSAYIFLSHHFGIMLCCNMCAEWCISITIITYILIVAFLTLIFKYLHKVLVRYAGVI